MNASVTNMADFAARVLRRPKSESEIACESIRKRLQGQCTHTRISQALARAERLIAAGYPPDRAIARVVAWATCADDPTPPPLAA